MFTRITREQALDIGKITHVDHDGNYVQAEIDTIKDLHTGADMVLYRRLYDHNFNAWGDHTWLSCESSYFHEVVDGQARFTKLLHEPFVMIEAPFPENNEVEIVPVYYVVRNVEELKQSPSIVTFLKSHNLTIRDVEFSFCRWGTKTNGRLAFCIRVIEPVALPQVIPTPISILENVSVARMDDHYRYFTLPFHDLAF